MRLLITDRFFYVLSLIIFNSLKDEEFLPDGFLWVRDGANTCNCN
jgi:hypothetical protein